MALCNCVGRVVSKEKDKRVSMLGKSHNQWCEDVITETQSKGVYLSILCSETLMK